jgi:hypothetical protein
MQNVQRCPRCGGPVSIGARFCGTCGLVMPAPAPQAPGYPQAGGWYTYAGPPATPPEQILGTIPEARTRTGIFSSDMYVLVVTDRRLIGAKVTGDLLKRIIADARAEAKAAGGGFFRQWAAQIGASASLNQRYARLAPEAILAETPGNWDLYPAQVRAIHISRHDREGPDGGIMSRYLSISIETQQGTLHYDTDTESPNRDAARAMLAHTFGPLVRG